MKKVKLFTTIASLCLAVALMAFGVYAATDITHNVKGSISFESTGIFGAWEVTEVSVVGGEFDGAAEGEETSIKTGLASLTQVPNVTATNAETVNVTITIKAKYTPAEGSTVLATLSVVENTKEGCTISVVNDGALASETTAKEVTVTISFTTTQQASAEAEYDITFKASAPANNN